MFSVFRRAIFNIKIYLKARLVRALDSDFVSDTSGLRRDIAEDVFNRLVNEEPNRGDRSLRQQIGDDVIERVVGRHPILKQVYIPDAAVHQLTPVIPFMPYSTCSASDFFHPSFYAYCQKLGHPVMFHRKLWEWVFILHKSGMADANAAGRRGLVFGVGTEPLPAAFAAMGLSVHATDAPAEVGQAGGWTLGNQLAVSLANIPSGALPRDRFEQLVSFSHCDMNAIDPELIGFDLCWSSCALEHLGSLEHGLEFIVNSVEKTLRVGGRAVHTTEFNLSSNEETVDHTDCVIYRRKDLESLCQRLLDLGHQVEAFVVAPDRLFMDNFADAPPYGGDVHLKLKLGQYITTSAGLVITRGR